jgi:hypothetical protein
MQEFDIAIGFVLQCVKVFKYSYICTLNEIFCINPLFQLHGLNSVGRNGNKSMNVSKNLEGGGRGLFFYTFRHSLGESKTTAKT